ncbi:hypothetical protein CLUG_03510 [Clavispora lusitaniae ATCC 42720]|uniref:DHHA2 domain-containing protein n=1 Tax=Clavispora lusitaniae (strain ATCC 42720) TaxID=306902 RepID=C4Y5S6_CLAL4|nr:uncharacterized protein CLUG_03510 [Clavispora lusitaniae ATCC 42720]EEQ39382.1 hypothetical protein CLUG_03510 [Clavispora lusitaniae ATCC 42720]
MTNGDTHQNYMSLKSFLQRLRSAVKPCNVSNVIRLVTGNQSADMDSVVSAISYSFLHSQKFPNEQPFLPMVNIAREEMKLRRDIMLLLKSHSITEDDLFFLDDVSKLAESGSTKFEVVLVDHCNIQGELLHALHEQNRIQVTGIIDHHADEEVFKDANPRLIQPNGSCTCLVFNYWYEQLGGQVPLECVSLLLGPLLIDTSNMTQKVEQGDVEAFSRYEKLLQSTSVPLETTLAVADANSLTSFYSVLKGAKKDLEGFSFYDILRKDYKQFVFTSVSGVRVAIGFSSIGKGMSWLTKKYPAQEISSSLDQMLANFHLDAMVMTTSFTKKETNEHLREFSYYSSKPELKDLAKYATGLDLNQNIYNSEIVSVAAEEINKNNLFQVFNQGNVNATRKQVVPIVKSIIEEGKLI